MIVSKQHGCKFWSSLAYNLTHIHEQVGDMMHMVCENDNNTDGGGCQEMKCGGRFQQSLPVSICFLKEQIKCVFWDN